jgi:phospholipase D1/2
MSRRDDDLAYGDYHGQEGEEGDRGLIGDMGRRFGFGRKEVSYILVETPCCHCTP